MKSFNEEVMKVPSDYRCYQKERGGWKLPLKHCLLGVPESRFFGWETMTEVPKDLIGFVFYLGGDYEELLKAFAESKFPKQTEYLTIGNSSFHFGSTQNYVNSVKNISNIPFPVLRELELGIWELYENSNGLMGKIGDVTNILKNSPSIEKLELHGYMVFRESLNFLKLRNFTIDIEDWHTGTGGGYITKETLNNFFDSEYPMLEELYFDLECDEDDFGYEFTDKFLEGENLPNIKKIEISGGFKKGEVERFFNSPIGKSDNVIYYMEDIKES